MALKEGAKAPAFSLPDKDGNNISLPKGKAVVYFYPKDMTPGCTIQACDFTKDLPKYKKKGVTIFGISKDSPKSHQKFVDKEKLKIILLSDEDVSVAKKYGVWVEKSMYGRKYMGIERSTFLIDKGKIVKIYAKVKPAGHSEDILKNL